MSLALYALLYVFLVPYVGIGIASLSAVVAIFAGYTLGTARGVGIALALSILNVYLESRIRPTGFLEPNDALFAAVDVTLAAVAASWRSVRDKLRESTKTATEASIAAQEAKTQLHTLIHNAPDLIFVHKDRRLLFANLATARTMGRRGPEELLGLDVASFVAPEFRASVQDRLARVARGETVPPIRLKVGLDGTTSWVETRSILTTWEGRPAILTLGRDVTAAVAQSAALDEKRQLLERAEEIAHMGSWQVRSGALKGKCSRNMPVLLGLAQTDDFDLGVFSAGIDAGDIAGFGEDIALLQKGGKPASRIIKFMRPDGQQRYLRSYLHAEGDEVHGLTQDVTEEVHADQLLARSEKLSALGTLVAGVAHEINNPLSYMRGNVELSDLDIDDAITDPQKAALFIENLRASHATVLQGIDRITAITQSLKQLSRSAETPVGSVDPNDVINEIAVVARTRNAKSTTIEVQANATESLQGSRTQIAQVLLNLALNAIDATHDNKEGRVVLRSVTCEGGTCFEVEDNGQGIPLDTQRRIFEPFFTTKATGTGLGLALSHRIVEEHGGTLTFKSRPGVGTTFYVKIPNAPRELPRPVGRLLPPSRSTTRDLGALRA